MNEGLRKQILDSADLPREQVPCPEWGCDIWIRTVGAVEKDMFEEASLVKRGKGREPTLRNIRARMVVLCATDADGRQLFLPGDAENLGAKSSRVVSRLYDVACRLNAWSDEDVKELAKNSESVPTETLPSP
jgi:hypothetical protein